MSDVIKFKGKFDDEPVVKYKGKFDDESKVPNFPSMEQIKQRGQADATDTNKAFATGVGDSATFGFTDEIADLVGGDGEGIRKLKGKDGYVPGLAFGTLAQMPIAAWKAAGILPKTIKALLSPASAISDAGGVWAAQSIKNADKAGKLTKATMAKAFLKGQVAPSAAVGALGGAGDPMVTGDRTYDALLGMGLGGALPITGKALSEAKAMGQGGLGHLLGNDALLDMYNNNSSLSSGRKFTTDYADPEVLAILSDPEKRAKLAGLGWGDAKHLTGSIAKEYKTDPALFKSALEDAGDGYGYMQGVREVRTNDRLPQKMSNEKYGDKIIAGMAGYDETLGNAKGSSLGLLDDASQTHNMANHTNQAYKQTEKDLLARSGGGQLNDSDRRRLESVHKQVKDEIDTGFRQQQQLPGTQWALTDKKNQSLKDYIENYLKPQIEQSRTPGSDLVDPVLKLYSGNLDDAIRASGKTTANPGSQAFQKIQKETSDGLTNMDNLRRVEGTTDIGSLRSATDATDKTIAKLGTDGNQRLTKFLEDAQENEGRIQAIMGDNKVPLTYQRGTPIPKDKNIGDLLDTSRLSRAIDATKRQKLINLLASSKIGSSGLPMYGRGSSTGFLATETYNQVLKQFERDAFIRSLVEGGSPLRSTVGDKLLGKLPGNVSSFAKDQISNKPANQTLIRQNLTQAIKSKLFN